MIQEFRITHFFNTAEGETAEYKNNGSKGRRQMVSVASTFSFETFYISRYIQGYLRTNKKLKDKYKDTDKKDKIIRLTVFVNALENSTEYFRESRGISCYTTNKYEDIMPLRGTKRADKVLEIVSISANEFEKYIPGIKEALDEAVDSFRQADYRNIWIHQKKRLKGIGTVKLVCEISMFEFTLDLIVEGKDKEIYKKRLITTMPDSLSWHSMFKTLIVSEDEISVTDRIYEKPFFTISVKDMIANRDGKFINFYPNYEVKEDLGVTPTRKSEHFEAFKKCMKTPEGIPCPQFDEQ